MNSMPIQSGVAASGNKSSGTTEYMPDLAFRGTLGPEAEFVVLSARNHLAGQRLTRWAHLLQKGRDFLDYSPKSDAVAEQSLDWTVILKLAARHRVLGLLGRHLSVYHWENVPKFAVQIIQSYFQRTLVHSTILKGELADVSQALESAGIPVVSFKGPTLALAIYGNAVVRPSADLDLLVPRRHVTRARELLRELGYLPEAVLSPSQERVHLRVDSVLNMFRPAPEAVAAIFPQGLSVELHWNVTSPCLPFDLDFESVESRLTFINLPDVTGDKASVRALSPEDLLLILCVHGAKHLWDRLIWLTDVAELLSSTPNLDWDFIFAEVRTRGIQRMTTLGLVLARDVVGAVLPASVERWLTTQPESLRLASQIRMMLFTPDSDGREIDTKSPGHDPTSDRLLMKVIDDPRRRFFFVWHILTTPSAIERASVPLPPGFDFLWWGLRPFAMARKRLLARAGSTKRL